MTSEGLVQIVGLQENLWRGWFEIIRLLIVEYGQDKVVFLTGLTEKVDQISIKWKGRMTGGEIDKKIRGKLGRSFAERNQNTGQASGILNFWFTREPVRPRGSDEGYRYSKIPA